MKMRETSRGDDKKLHVNNIQDKGVVSKIKPDKDMPVDEDGLRAEIILNALGVFNRMNPAQLFELEINFISNEITKRMKKLKHKEARDLFFEYLSLANKKQYLFLKKKYKALDSSNKKSFIKNIKKNGIYIHQPPFWNNIGFDELSKLYLHFDIKPKKLVVNGCKTNPVIIADKYILKLKHKSFSKFSARSSAFINSKNMPSKNMAFKKHEKLYSSTPIRIGEMELFNLLICKKPELICNMLKYYSSSQVGREKLFKQLLTQDPLQDNVMEYLEENNNMEILNVYLKSLGLEIEF